MLNFGYIISKQRVVDLDKNDSATANRIYKFEPSFNLCIGCGTCTATCSANQFTTFNLRNLMLLVKRGETAKAAEEAQKCMLCGKCTLACPRGVNTRNVLLSISKVCKTQNAAK